MVCVAGAVKWGRLWWKKAFIETNTIKLTGMWINLENWSSWELCYCRKSSLNFIVHIHKTECHQYLPAKSISFSLILMQTSSLVLFTPPFVLVSKYYQYYSAAKKNMSHIFPVCLILVLPALSAHPTFFCVLFYFLLYDLQGSNPIFLIFCIYKWLHWLFSGDKGTADSLSLFVTV